MSAADFQAVVAALDTGNATSPPEAPAIETVAVLGANPLGQTLAASALAAGVRVRLWTPHGAERDALRTAGGITVRGDALVGSYSLDDSADRYIELVDGIDDAVENADAIFIPGSVTEQRSIAMLLAHVIEERAMVVVVPGLTFGALELRWWLRSVAGSSSNTIVEIQDAPWGIAGTGPGRVEVTARAPARMAAIPAGAGIGAAAALHSVLPMLEQHPTVIHTSMSDVTGAVEVPALVFGGPAIQADPEALLPGAVPLADTPLGDTLTEPLAGIIGRLAHERRTVAQKWGVRDLPPDPAWMAQALEEHMDGARAPHGASARRRVLQGTAGSLVPLSSAAEVVDVDTPTTDALIELVTAMFGFDLGAAGRRVSAMGLDRADVDEIRKAVSAAPRST